MMMVFAPVSATLINRIGPKYTLMLGATRSSVSVTCSPLSQWARPGG